MDLVESVIRRWVVQAEVGEGRRPGTTSAEHEEIMALCKRVRVLQEEREVLKKAARLFSQRRPGEPVSVHRSGEAQSCGKSPLPSA